MKQGGFFKRTINDVPLDNKTVLVRVDYNVPLENGIIKDDYRVRSSMPTIQALLERGCKVVLIAHLGRPKGERNLEFTLEPVAERLQELIGQPVIFVPDCIGDVVTVAVKHMGKEQIALLENTRFYPGEEANDPQFAAQLAKDSMAEYFVQDGFGVVHRDQASTAAITQFLPSVAGLLLVKEVTSITAAMEDPKRPLTAVMGGAKISDKIQLVERFVEIADRVIIGGAMANNFLKYQGFPVGKSLVEENIDDTVRRVYRAVEEKVGKDEVDNFLVIPQDVAVAKEINASVERGVKSREAVDSDDIILDIGDHTMRCIDESLGTSGTVIWNGTLGYAELPQFAHGSARLALYLASHQEIVSIIGGGDTADFALHWDAARGQSFHLVSTGGGASLELMAGKKLPGVEALMDA